MLIGELSRLSGFSRHTIRYYEKEGLITLGRKDRQVNNYKDYPESVLRRLLHLKKLKSFGFTLQESAELLALIEEDLATCRRVSHLVEQKLADIDRKISELQQLREQLQSGVERCLNGEEPGEDRVCTMVVSRDK